VGAVVLVQLVRANISRPRAVCARVGVLDSGATLDDLREAVDTCEETARVARRVLGGTNPTAMNIEGCLRQARAALRARETPSPPGGV
jgi:hypothetical protein